MPTYHVTMNPLSRLFGKISFAGLAEGDYVSSSKISIRRIATLGPVVKGISGPSEGYTLGARKPVAQNYRDETEREPQTRRVESLEEHLDETVEELDEVGLMRDIEEGEMGSSEEILPEEVPSADDTKAPAKETSPEPAAGGFFIDDISFTPPLTEDAPKEAPELGTNRKLEEAALRKAKRGSSPTFRGAGLTFRGAGPTLGGARKSTRGYVEETQPICGEEILPPSENYKSKSYTPEALPGSLPALPRLPAEISALEEMLSLAYKLPVKITRIKKLPQTRKEVKEVYFLINETNLSKVWVFKAEPEKTRNELNAYAIIHRQGILTGEPLGYQPSASSYPYDVAILGGVVEHAGDPYEQMLENLYLDPRTIFSTAQAIARTMADYQIKLTKAKAEFEQYGISLLRADPGKEIEERLLAALGKTEAQASGLIDACRQLYNAQNSSPLVSHGDCHLGNIVTIMDKEYGGTLSTKKFGMIDWGSLQFDTPFGDVQDFWLHHQRKAQQVCENYPFSVSQLENTFLGALREVARENGRGLTLDENDSLIQSALWNLYEMYDPTRKDPADIETKARVHAQGLWDSLDALKEKRPYLRELTETIKREVTVVVGEKCIPF